MSNEPEPKKYLTSEQAQRIFSAMDALTAGKVRPTRQMECPICQGTMDVKAQQVGNTLRLWMRCSNCPGFYHVDRAAMFPGWEVLDY